MSTELPVWTRGRFFTLSNSRKGEAGWAWFRGFWRQLCSLPSSQTYSAHAHAHTLSHTHAHLQPRWRLRSGTSQEAEWGGPGLGVLKGRSCFAAVAATLRGKGWSKACQGLRGLKGSAAGAPSTPTPCPTPGSLPLLSPGPRLPSRPGWALCRLGPGGRWG